MNILYRCDQCTHEEWREEWQEPWLCVVCGYMRWQEIAAEADLSEKIEWDCNVTEADEGPDEGKSET